MGRAKAVVKIFSPRWGREDEYDFHFHEDKLEIVHGPNKLTATQQEGRDPIWQGRSLIEMLQNDSIYPPAGIERLIESLWRAWRNGELTDEELQPELTAFGEYLNASTRAKPSTEFWERVF